MSDDARMIELLVAVRDVDRSGHTVDNALLVAELGWPEADVAACVVDARQRMLLWGTRTGGTAQPHFSDIEVTVQGSRLLANGGHREEPPLS